MFLYSRNSKSDPSYLFSYTNILYQIPSKPVESEPSCFMGTERWTFQSCWVLLDNYPSIQNTVQISSELLQRKIEKNTVMEICIQN